MKAITIWQPWGSAIAIEAKGYETRGWATSYRGPIAIHAAKRPYMNIIKTLPADTQRLLQQLDYIVPTAQEMALGDWTPGRYAWELRNIKLLPEPIPAKGQQGLWNWEPPEEVLA